MSELEMESKPVRVQRRRVKGWRMPPNTVSVRRPGVYGNPFIVGVDGDAEECVRRFRECWEFTLKQCQVHPRTPPAPFGEPIFLGPLKGKNLACFCPEAAPFCHADVLLDIANRPLSLKAHSNG